MKEWAISRYDGNPDSPFTKEEVAIWKEEKIQYKLEKWFYLVHEFTDVTKYCKRKGLIPYKTKR